jgi:hypothetical protein
MSASLPLLLVLARDRQNALVPVFYYRCTAPFHPIIIPCIMYGGGSKR